jgi:hypothetical protein
MQEWLVTPCSPWDPSYRRVGGLDLLISHALLESLGGMLSVQSDTFLEVTIPSDPPKRRKLVGKQDFCGAEDCCFNYNSLEDEGPQIPRTDLLSEALLK